jgi:methylated-DNA-[protein]-cysteine S-methyltransferase
MQMKKLLISPGEYFLGAAFTPNGLAVLTLPFSQAATAEADLMATLASLNSTNFEFQGLADHGQEKRLIDDLQRYFAGGATSFEDVKVDLSPHGLTPFQLAVLNQVKSIPYGLLKSYRQVAEAAGSPRGARAVGQAIGRNPVPIVIPCHRVINAGGGLGGFTGGVDKKKILLRIEGFQPEQFAKSK